MLGDANMHESWHLREGHTVIAGLSGQNRDQEWVGDEMLDQVLGGAQRPLQQPRKTSGSLNTVTGIFDPSQVLEIFHHVTDGVQVAVNTLRFMWKTSFEPGSKGFFSLGNIELLITDHDMIITIRVHFTESQVLGDSQSFIYLAQRTPLLQSTDIMDTWAESITL